MSRKKNSGRALLAGALLLAAAAAGARSALAQCTLNGAISELDGSGRPASLRTSATRTSVEVFQASGSNRLLMKENFGYSVWTLADPAHPGALAYVDMRVTGEVVAAGDGQAYVRSMAASDDGLRAGFGLTSPAINLHAVVGASNGTTYPMAGDMLPFGASGGMAIQHSGARYLTYLLDGGLLDVAEATALPGLYANSLGTETTHFPGGRGLRLAGNFLVYMSTSTGPFVILDASSPGPKGSIATNFGRVDIANSEWNRAVGDVPVEFSAAVDPSDPSKLYVLAEFMSGAHSAGYSLMQVKGGVKTLVGSAFQLPTGETWGLALSSALLTTGGNLYALMWARGTSPSTLYRLYSIAVAGWGAVAPASFDVDPLALPSFTTGAMRGLAGPNGALWGYLATGLTAFALPMTCISPNSPPASDLVVQPVPCPGGGGSCPLNPNDMVYVGTQLQITPQIASAKTVTDWRFDYDFHAGSAEDNGSTSPRIKTADLAYPASLPSTVTLVGPCDPRNGGAPSSGAGCWASETANGDFAANAPPGTTKSLTIALEASNVNGYGVLKAVPLTWKIPAVRLQNPNILLGGTLASGSDGTPLSTGFKWYFGTSPNLLTPSACNGSTCQPPFGTKGTYYYWLTVPYPGGYTSPDCGSPCTQNLGAISITDVSLSFTGIPTTAVAGASVSVTDASSTASGVTPCGTGLQYAFCDASAGSCAASNWQPLGLVLGAHGSTSVTAPGSADPYWLRIRYSYTTSGSCTSPLVATWTPGVSGVSDPTAWPLAVTPVPPTIWMRVNGVDPCPPGPGGGCSGGIPANVGDTITVFADLNGAHDANPPPTTSWSFGAGASPATCVGGGCQGATFTYTAPGSPTISLSGYPGIADPAATKLMSVSVPPVAASNSTLPSGVCMGSSVTLVASPTVSGASYSWVGPGNFSSTQQNPVFVPAASGTYTVTRTISGQPNSNSSTTAILLTPPAVPTAANNSPVCSGQTLSLTAATVSGASYGWTGPNGFTSTLQNPSISNAAPAATGTYVVTATLNGCSTAASTSAVVNAPPPAAVAGNDGPLCVGGTLHLTASTIANATYAWTGPNGFSSSQQNPSIANVTPAAAGTYAVTATVNGCAGPAGTTTAVVNGSSPAITAPYSLCIPNVMSGTASVANAGAGATYAWTVTNGTIVSGQGTPTLSFSVSAAGTTTVAVVVTAGGCVTSSTAPIPVAAQCGGLSTLAPCRVLDTRNPNGASGGPALGPSSRRKFVADGVCGVPPGMSALSANVTVLSRDAQGSIVVYPGDLPSPPGVSTVSIGVGQTRANSAIVKLAPDGSFWIWNTTSGTVDVILDVSGVFQ